MKVTLSPLVPSEPHLPAIFLHRASNALYIIGASASLPPPMPGVQPQKRYSGVLVKNGTVSSPGQCIQLSDLADFERYHGVLTLENE